ncbi:hypothetical protein EDB19DRAFT_746573 [Suillus lakei]|nr:hypothetical protein EDB19DRAFT_746573 [Suillus lakei]
MSALQGTQPDAILWFKYCYVALTSLWVYDHVLCVSDSVTYLVESRWGLGTLFYLVCSYLPSAFLLLCMLSEYHIYTFMSSFLTLGYFHDSLQRLFSLMYQTLYGQATQMFEF